MLPYFVPGLLFNKLLAVADAIAHTKEPAKTVEYGDVICVKRTGYYHFGVYANDKRIIHFAPLKKFNAITDAMNGAVIHETDMENFIGDGKELFVCNFKDIHSIPKKYKVGQPGPGTTIGAGIAPMVGIFSIIELFKAMKYKVYSPEETVSRAESKIGKSDYNLVSNNCEHFAIWCKTGISESHQVNEVMKNVLALRAIPMLPIPRI